jgi:hypothetical protein
MARSGLMTPLQRREQCQILRWMQFDYEHVDNPRTAGSIDRYTSWI